MNDDVNDVNFRWPLVVANQISPWMKIWKYCCHIHQAQWWQVFLVIAMKVCHNNRVPWCDERDFEGFHPWITFVKDDSRATLKGEWYTKLFKLKMLCCSYMHWKFHFHENGNNFKMAIVGMSMEIKFAFFFDRICKIVFEVALPKSFQQIQTQWTLIKVIIRLWFWCFIAESENEDCGVTIMMVVFAFVVRFFPLTWNIKQIKN